MKPAQQGAFDGLCGVYAIINALDLVGLQRRRSALHTDLFIQLTHGLGASALLSAMYYGLEPSDLVRAADAAFHWLAIVYGPRLEISQPFLNRRFSRVPEYLQALAEYVEAPDSAALISFKRPGRSHWTVVKAMRGQTILLRDSAGLMELDSTEFSLDRGPACIRVWSTLIIQSHRT